MSDTDAWIVDLREQQLRDLRAQLAAANARAEATEAKLTIVTAERDRFHKNMEKAAQHDLGMEEAAERERQRAEAAEAQLALVERYGADQWRRGNTGKEPQEFGEWQHFRA